MAREQKDVLSDSEIAYREFWGMVIPDDTDCENALKRLLAAVWDEGHEAACDFPTDCLVHPNPYEEA